MAHTVFQTGDGQRSWKFPPAFWTANIVELFERAAYCIGFGISGYLLNAYCPDPRTLTPAQLVHAYDGAYVLWYYFAAIGFTAALALALYAGITRRWDARKTHGARP